jgi:hypothetical protein
MNLITRAVNQPTLDDAVRVIQDSFGITDGGPAGIFYSEVDPDEWIKEDRTYRWDSLCRYAMWQLRWLGEESV